MEKVVFHNNVNQDTSYNRMVTVENVINTKLLMMVEPVNKQYVKKEK